MIRIEFITLLKEPLWRYISEWNHIRTFGGVWKGSYRCNGIWAKEYETPSCVNGNEWKNVSLEVFSKCPFNLALNRQTRMLSNRTLAGCYNNSFISKKALNKILLESAKKNLAQMKFFGLSEFMYLNQYLFEKTFPGIIFAKNLEEKRNQLELFSEHRGLSIRFQTWSFSLIGDIKKSSPSLMKIIKANIKLDIELYKFAKELFFKRVTRVLENDEKFRSSKFYKKLFTHISSSFELELFTEDLIIILQQLYPKEIKIRRVVEDLPPPEGLDNLHGDNPSYLSPPFPNFNPDITNPENQFPFNAAEAHLPQPN